MRGGSSGRRIRFWGMRSEVISRDSQAGGASRRGGGRGGKGGDGVMVSEAFH